MSSSITSSSMPPLSKKPVASTQEKEIITEKQKWLDHDKAIPEKERDAYRLGIEKIFHEASSTLLLLPGRFNTAYQLSSNSTKSIVKMNLEAQRFFDQCITSKSAHQKTLQRFDERHNRIANLTLDFGKSSATSHSMTQQDVFDYHNSSPSSERKMDGSKDLEAMTKPENDTFLDWKAEEAAALERGLERQKRLEGQGLKLMTNQERDANIDKIKLTEQEREALNEALKLHAKPKPEDALFRERARLNRVLDSLEVEVMMHSEREYLKETVQEKIVQINSKILKLANYSKSASKDDDFDVVEIIMRREYMPTRRRIDASALFFDPFVTEDPKEHIKNGMQLMNVLATPMRVIEGQIEKGCNANETAQQTCAMLGSAVQAVKKEIKKIPGVTAAVDVIREGNQRVIDKFEEEYDIPREKTEYAIDSMEKVLLTAVTLGTVPVVNALSKTKKITPGGKTGPKPPSSSK